MRRVRSARADASRAVDLMLDSGAFSAWTRGEEIDLGEYIDFVGDHEGLLGSYINLDVIPGPARGRHATRDEVEAAARASLANYRKMTRAGLSPVPVFHYGEGFDWLERILDTGADYIGLGGTVGKATTIRRSFFRRCFKVISARPDPPKVHSFGTTSLQLMREFPWYSADSTSWVMAGATGAILVPRSAPRGGFDFSRIHTVRVTGMGSTNRQSAGLGEFERAHLTAYLESERATLEEVSVSREARCYVNLRCLKEVAAVAGVRIIFSSWLRDLGTVLTGAGARDRLVSYVDVAGEDGDSLARYVAEGSLDSDNQRKKWSL